MSKSKKRSGRGMGSGKGGHTVGRGQKGQKSRSKLNILFEGVKVKKSKLRRFPLQRGKGKFKAAQKPIIVNLELLNGFSTGAVVDEGALVKAGIVRLEDVKKQGVKILGNGQLKTKKLHIKLPISKSAAKEITKLGGKIDEVSN